MKQITVVLEFNDEDLGEHWMNKDNFELLLYGKDWNTKEELLRIISYDTKQLPCQCDTLDNRGMMNTCNCCGKEIH